jgi:hypothetical protein
MALNRVFIVLAPILACAFTPILLGAPPELAPLQEQYARAVTAPFEAGQAALVTKYSTALENAANTAKQDGLLDEVLALTQEQKRLADGLPIPEEEDGAHETLKKLRTIYHEQCARLAAEREASRTRLLPAYTEKLKELESALTKADRIPAALEVKTYREGLAVNALPTAPPVVTMPRAATPVPEGKTVPETAKPSVPKVRGDDRKAAEWILANWKEHRMFAGNTLINGPGDLPAGKFSLTSIAIDGNHYSGQKPLDAEAFMSNLGGLEELNNLGVSHFADLKDADYAFLGTLEALDSLSLRGKNLTDGIVVHILRLPVLRLLKITDSVFFTGASLGQWKSPPVEELGFFKSRINDAGVSALAGFRKLQNLDLSGQKDVTDASLEVLRALPSLQRLYVPSTGITPEGLAAVAMPRVTHLGCNQLSSLGLREIAPVVAPSFPNLRGFTISYAVKTAEDISALAHFKKVIHLTNGAAYIEDDAWAGLIELRELEYFSHPSTVKPIPDSVLSVLTQLKKLKRLEIGSAPPSPAALAAFKAARPDVEITTD